MNTKKNTRRPAGRCAPPAAGTDPAAAPAEEKTVLSVVISASGRGRIAGGEGMAGVMVVIGMAEPGGSAAWVGWEHSGIPGLPEMAEDWRHYRARFK